MQDFPALIPTARSFKLGQYPVKTYRAMSGAIAQRSFGNRPYGYTLDLEFKNISEDKIILIIDHYDEQGGGTIGFNVPAIVFQGYSGALQSRIRTATGIEWFYVDPPSISNVIKNISTATVQLAGEMK